MILPKIRNQIYKANSEMVAIRGLNMSDNFRDGDMAYCRNISTKRYPYITTRKDRKILTEYGEVTAMTSFDKLITIKNNRLYYDNELVGGGGYNTFTEGEKQFAVINTKVVIFPDKKYLDLTELKVHELESVFEYYIENAKIKFLDNSLIIGKTINGEFVPGLDGIDFGTYFKPGDAVEIEGAYIDNDKTFVIKNIPNTYTLETTSNAFIEVTHSLQNVTISRKVPDMDFICESENRLRGCSSETQTIYASALGDPTNFNVYEGLTTDSYAVAVGTEGGFTGCIGYSSSVLFFKEQKLHKMLGSYPAEYSLYTYDVDGVESLSSKSLVVINEVLYYLGTKGVYAYTGGVPTLISQQFGNHKLENGHAGTNGEEYYLVASDITDGHTVKFFIYDTKTGIWVMENGIVAEDFTRCRDELYFIDSNGTVVAEDYHPDNFREVDGDERDWEIQFKPFYETIEGRKCYSKLMMRVELPKGSWMEISMKEDEKPRRTFNRIVGKNNDVVSMRIPVTRCDKFELKLNGDGPMTILSLLREFYVGSDR